MRLFFPIRRTNHRLIVPGFHGSGELPSNHTMVAGLTEITEARGAEQRLRYGVAHHVGVAVAGEAARMRHRNPAEHDRAFAGKAVDVEAKPGPRDEASGEHRLGPVPVCRRRQFVEEGIAFDHRDGNVLGSQECRLIGGSGRTPILVGAGQSFQSECLGCLNPVHFVSLNRVTEGLDPGDREALFEAGRFAAFDAPGYVKVAFNIRVEPYGSGRALITTETRTAATDPASLRRFARYWLLVGPFSALIRRLTLRIVLTATVILLALAALALAPLHHRFNGVDWQ